MYPTNQSSNIGTLLRMIREDQTKSIAATPPGTQPGSATRELVQQPISSPEDPGSSRVVSVRPEGATQSGESVSSVAPIAPPNVVGPVAPIAPVAPTPAPTPSQPSQAAQPSQARASTPSPIGTIIKSSAPQAVLGTSTKASTPIYSSILDYNKKFFVPQPTRVGNKVVGGQNLIPTPTPAPQNTSKKPSATQQINSSFYRA